MVSATPICFKFARQTMLLARSLAEARAGSSSAARMEIIAITTSNSIRVNAQGRRADLRKAALTNTATRRSPGWRSFRIISIIVYQRLQLKQSQANRAVFSVLFGVDSRTFVLRYGNRA